MASGKDWSHRPKLLGGEKSMSGDASLSTRTERGSDVWLANFLPLPQSVPPRPDRLLGWLGPREGARLLRGAETPRSAALGETASLRPCVRVFGDGGDWRSRGEGV